MPAKNSLKTYSKDSYYHLYNRGVEKRIIFQDRQDYNVFLSYLKTYLLPKDEMMLKNLLSDPTSTWADKEKVIQLLRMNNFAEEISLIAYCLMPNHFHFLLKQKSSNAIDRLMSSLGTRYTMYFNKKYKRVGSLYQAVYKAVCVESNEQLLHLSSYIHRNPLSKKQMLSQPSSLPEYLTTKKKSEWVHPDIVLSYFSKTNPKLSYKSFVLQTEDLFLIEKLSIDIDN